MHAYDEIYLEGAGRVLGGMYDHAVADLGMDICEIQTLFISSGIARRFAVGEADIIAGCSGPELVYRILDQVGLNRERVEPGIRSGFSREYWTGWALAYYQWRTGLSFSRIERSMPIQTVRDHYTPYHEMDIKQFADMMDREMQGHRQKTMLARLRSYAGYSQAMLARESGVSVRTIQQYEQRQKDISKAGAAQLEQLARALWSDPHALVEETV